MRYLYIILLLVLFSSCNLFRKVNKETLKTKETTEVIQKAETKAQEVINNKVQNNIKTSIVSNSEGFTVAYGKDLTVHPDGTITGADSVKTSNKNTAAESKEDLSTSNTTSVKDSVSNSSSKQSNNKTAAAGNTESTTDWKLYVFLFAILLTIGFVLWLKLK